METVTTIAAESKLATWRHQDEALAAVDGKRGFLLAMAMGTGKSRTAILALERRKARLVVILCPKSVVEVWPEQFERHAGESWRILVLEKGTCKQKAAELREAIRNMRRPLAVIVNYESAWREPLGAALQAVEFDAVIYDECVAAGTLISTPSGRVPIEQIQVGDEVLGFDHQLNKVVATRVRHTFRRLSKAQLVIINGVRLTCNHPVWTLEEEYVEAGKIRGGHTVCQAEEHSNALEGFVPPQLRMVPACVSGQEAAHPVLREAVLVNVESYSRNAGAVAACHESNDPAPRGAGKVGSTSALGIESIPVEGQRIEARGTERGARVLSPERRKRTPAVSPANGLAGSVGLETGVRCGDWSAREWLPDALQNRRSESGSQNSDRGGRLQPHNEDRSTGGREERRVSEIEGLDSASILEPGSDSESGCGSRQDPALRFLYNLETGTGNYFAGGLLVHNCHRVKDPGGKASKFCKALSMGTAKTFPIPFRLGLTGTPMPHSPLDVYAQFRALDTNVFGSSYTAFKSRYAVMNPVITGKVDAFQNLDELARKMGAFTYQVDASVLNLPDPVHTERIFDLSPRGRAVYRALEENLIAEVETGTIVAANALAKLLRLRQVTGGTTRIEDGESVRVDDGKADALAEVLADLPLREPLVVVAVFHADLDRIREVCEANGRTVLELSGRRNELAEWKGGGADVLAVQIQAGGVGIDLTRACHSILWSVGFSLGEYEQFLARTQRPGQTRFVNYIHLLARGTVDFAVYRALRARANVVEAVLATMKGRKAA